MKPKVGQYFYAIRGNSFRIYRCTEASDDGYCSSPVIAEPCFPDRESARKRVYELNGWKYKDK